MSIISHINFRPFFLHNKRIAHYNTEFFTFFGKKISVFLLVQLGLCSKRIISCYLFPLIFSEASDQHINHTFFKKEIIRMSFPYISPKLDGHLPNIRNRDFQKILICFSNVLFSTIKVKTR